MRYLVYREQLVGSVEAASWGKRTLTKHEERLLTRARKRLRLAA